MALYPASVDKEQPSSASLRHSGDLDLMSHAMLNIAKELLDPLFLVSVFIYQDSIVSLIANDEREEEWFSESQVTLDRLLKAFFII